MQKAAIKPFGKPASSTEKKPGKTIEIPEALQKRMSGVLDNANKQAQEIINQANTVIILMAEGLIYSAGEEPQGWTISQDMKTLKK